MEEEQMKNRSTKLLFVAIFMIAIFAFSAISASAAEVSYDETVVYDGTRMIMCKP